MDKKQENIDLLNNALSSLCEMTNKVKVLLQKVEDDTATREDATDTDFSVGGLFNSEGGVFDIMRQVHANFTIGTSYEWIYWHEENGVLVPGEDKERKSIIKSL